jgi:hypothetical protein
VVITGGVPLPKQVEIPSKLKKCKQMTSAAFFSRRFHGGLFSDNFTPCLKLVQCHELWIGEITAGFAQQPSANKA